MALKFEQYLLNIERLDQLIRLKCTGTPEAIAQRLNISRSTLYRYLDLMKSMGAPIFYSPENESFVYQYPVALRLGFSPKLSSTADCTYQNSY